MKKQQIKFFIISFVVLVISSLFVFPTHCIGEGKKNRIIENDTVWWAYSSSHENNYISGLCVYKLLDDKKPCNDNIFLCLLKGKNLDSLIVFTNLYTKDFSLGAPFEQVKDSVIKAKFKNYNDFVSFEQDMMGIDDDDCPPHDLCVMIGGDTIVYRSDESHQNWYGFDYAILHNQRFSYGEYKMNKKITDCEFGTLIPYRYLKGVCYVELLQCRDYNHKLWKSRSVSSDNIQNVILNIEKEQIKSIVVNYFM